MSIVRVAEVDILTGLLVLAPRSLQEAYGPRSAFCNTWEACAASEVMYWGDGRIATKLADGLALSTDHYHLQYVDH
jgi:hypothetical protein